MLFFSGAFPLLDRLGFPAVQPAIRTCPGTVPDDLFVEEEERAHPNYQTGSVELTQGRDGRAPSQKLVCFFSLKVVFACLPFSVQVEFGCRRPAGFHPPEVDRQTPANGHGRLLASTAAFVFQPQPPQVK